ncbi:hypothetical protein LLG96_05725 [bacterium]|nr:hypothetical protein [bacterium]
MFQRPVWIMAIIAAGTLVAGCLPNYYAGIRGSHVPPIAAAPVRDGQKYRLIGIDAGNGTSFNNGEYNHLARARFLLAISDRRSDTNLGFMAYQGRYSATHVGDYNGVYDYYGLAPTLSHVRFFSRRHVDAGIGAHVTFAFEGGDYLSFRRRTDRAGRAENDTAAISAFLALYPMVRYRPDDISSLTFQLALGSWGPFSPSLMYQKNRSFFWLYWMPNYMSGDTVHGFGSFAVGFGSRL